MTTSQINPNQLRPSGDDGLGPIIKVDPERRAEAVERLLAAADKPDREHARRFIDYANSHRVSLDCLWARLDRHGRIEFTALAVPSPGRTAMVFASHPARRDQLRSLAGLIDCACRQLVHLNVNLAQVLLDPGELMEQQAFLGGGFHELAVLSYLERPLYLMRGPLTPPPQWPDGCVAVAFHPAMRKELVEILDLTYEQTLDCPGLRGRRQTTDILEGHRASGAFEPSLWTILRMHGRGIGVLLLNPSSDHQTIELVYLGLAPAIRGRGLGGQLLRHGLLLLKGRTERTINLAVDENNAPAIALYRREGFRLSLRRIAMIRSLES